MSYLPFSIASYSFHGMCGAKTMDVFGYLETVASRYKVRGADIWNGFLPTLDNDFISRIRAELDRREMFLANLCVDGPHLWVADAEKREANRKRMLEFISAAKILGARTIRVDFGGDNGAMPEEAFDYIVARYKEYCAICGDAGIRIGPEDHWGWDVVPENVLKVARAVDSPTFGLLFHLRKFTPEETAALLPLAMHTHIHAESVTWAKPIIRALKKLNYAGTLSIEHHSGELELERVEWQLAWVREICAELEAEGENAADLDYMTSITRDK